MSEEPQNTTTLNEQYKAEIKKFTNKLDDTDALRHIYSFTKVYYEHCNERKEKK